MDRKVHDTLLKWKSSSGRALVLEGPRQTGKTFIMKEFSKSYHVCERGCGRGELHITGPRIQRLQDPLLQQTEQFAENGLRDIIQRTSYRIRDEIRKNEDIQIPADADLRGLQGGEGGSRSQTALWVWMDTGYSICRFSHPASSTSPA